MSSDATVLERASAAQVRLKSASALAFAPNAVLLVGDSLGARVYAYETGDLAPGGGPIQIPDLTGKIAALVGAAPDQIRVPDIAVNPVSGSVYIAVARGAGADADHLILKADASGRLTELDLDATPHTSAALADQPDAEKVDRRGNALRTDTITDLGYAGGKVIVAGLSNEEFASTLRAIPYPFEAGGERGAAIEIWHGAHGQYETNAPIRTFIAYEFDGQPEILASYTCTPLVRIPVAKLTPGAKVMGMTIAELGNMNRPLDMIAYRKDGSDHILMANSNRGVMKLDANGLDQYGPITDKIAATHGVPYETIGELQGVRRLDRLGEGHALAMVATGEALDLTTIALP
ncbi:MAG TPA: hypothetical protein VGG29_17300 [Caulobacteraceae bacterium]|jgi:hypothetical protein